MNTYIIHATHPMGTNHTFKVESSSPEEASSTIKRQHPLLTVSEVFLDTHSGNGKKGLTKLKQRSYLKVRLCQIRGNIQSMTDSEESFLTEEEILALQRITCKVDRVISLFEMRTMDLKKGGVI